MSSWIRHALRHPRGAAAVVFAAMLPALIGFTALSVDTSIVAVARSQLSTAVDSAALAGATRLASQQRLLAYPVGTSDVNDAQTRAIQFASSNKVLGNAALVLPNLTNANTGTEDLVLGYLSRPFDSSQAL